MEQNKDDVFKQFISQETSGMMQQPPKDIGKQVNLNTQKEEMVYGREFISIDPLSLPAGIFYKNGTKISIKAASVADVQEYSVVDNTNIVDVTEKMNLLLSRCVRFTHPSGKVGNYRDIKDNDRLFLIFMIRELTFQKGNNLAKEVSCDSCGHDFKIEFRATNSESIKKTFVSHEIDKELMEFFNNETKTFDFEIGKNLWKLCPPTIGIQEAFFENLKVKFQIEQKKNPSVAFLKIIPFTLWNMNTITDEEITGEEKKFKDLDMETFQTLNYITKKMENIGIKGLKTNCPVCGGEVHTDMAFPSGASDLFSVPSPLAKFKKK